MGKVLISGLLVLAAVNAGACRGQVAAAESRECSPISASMSNMRQIILGCILYAQDHDGKLPESLDAVEVYVGDKNVFSNPRQPGRKRGYIYVRPSKPYDKLMNIEELVLLYEAYDEWGEGIGVGFADGHVEFMKDRDRFIELLATSAQAGGPLAANTRAGVSSKVLAALDGLEKLGKTVKNLQGKLRLEKIETLVDDKTIKEGRLYYKREKEEIRFRITFEDTIYDRRRIKEPEHFVFANRWLTHRQERIKREDRYEVTRQGQPSSDLMRIGKSPLPIPIGQKTEEVLKNFKVTLIEPDEKVDPEKIETVHLKLVPKKKVESTVSPRLEFWLRTKDYLAVRSQWENDSGDIFTADITDLKINKRIKDKDFKLGRLPRDYDEQAHPLPVEEIHHEEHEGHEEE